MLQRGTIQECLLTKSRQEIGSGDALESRIVVACGDEFGPAHALIDQDGIPPVARQIDGSGQTGRSAADDQTVDHLEAPSGILPRTLAPRLPFLAFKEPRAEPPVDRKRGALNGQASC